MNNELLKIAKERYPSGTHFICAFDSDDKAVVSGDFSVDKDGDIYCMNGAFRVFIRNNGEWAKIIAGSEFKHYRYNIEYDISEGGDMDFMKPCLCLHTYAMVKETKCGYWIKEWAGGKKRWVSKTSRKRFAYPTKKEAYESLKIRLDRRIKYIKSDLKLVEEGIKITSASYDDYNKKS